jgi:flagellar protein FliO/FliZ
MGEKNKTMKNLSLGGYCALFFNTALAAGETRPPVPLGTGELLQVGLGLAVVLGAIGLAAWLLHRLGRVGGALGGALRVVGGLSVGTRERVVLVQVGERQLLLGVAPGRVQTLYVLDQPLSAPQPPAEFAAALRTLIRKQGQ